MADIEKLIGFTLPEEKGHPWPAQVFEPAEKKQPGKSAKPPAARGAAPEKAKPPAQKPPAPAPRRPVQNTGRAGAQQKGGPRRPAVPDDYETRTGAGSIITKRPGWSAAPAEKETEAPPPPAQNKGGPEMSRNQSRPRPQKQGAQAAGPSQPVRRQEKQAKAKYPEIKRDGRGLFDFSDEELAADDSLRLIADSQQSPETKFASFEDYLKGR